jgi:uncharacterized protein
MSDPLLIAKNDHTEIHLLPQMANRHGLIIGATGTGKTVTLQVLAEHFSAIGVPCFMSDVKGDLSGISRAGGGNAKVDARVAQLGLDDFSHCDFPVAFWDVWGEQGHPVRATVSDMGPLLLSRLLNLNDTQSGVLHLVFKIADDNGLLLLDMKDMRSMLQFVGDNARSFTTEYGNVSAASIGAIQRGLLALESQGGDRLFGEPMLDIHDLMQTDDGRGVVNILAADKTDDRAQGLLHPAAVAAVGTVREPAGGRRPGQTQAGVLFRRGAPAVRRRPASAGRQDRTSGAADPLQGGRGVLRHAEPCRRPRQGCRTAWQPRPARPARLHPRDQKAVRAAAETMRDNPALDEATAIMELGVGEALVSMLDAKGRPGVTERALILPPRAQIGPISAAERSATISRSLIAGHYEKQVDRESAHEILKTRAAEAERAAEAAAAEKAAATERASSQGSGGLLGGAAGRQWPP